MVVPAQTLAQLEPIVVAPPGDALEDSDVLEHDQISVQRALRDARVIDRHQLGHRDRPAGCDDEVEDLATETGVSLTDLGQASLGRGLDAVALRDGPGVRVCRRHIGKGIGA